MISSLVGRVKFLLVGIFRDKYITPLIFALKNERIRMLFFLSSTSKGVAMRNDKVERGGRSLAPDLVYDVPFSVKWGVDVDDVPPDQHPKYAERVNQTAELIEFAEMARAVTTDEERQELRDSLNKSIGEELFFTDNRLIPQHPDLGEAEYGFVQMPGGCVWAKTASGGCTFCDFQNAVEDFTDGLPLTAKQFYAMFAAGYATMPNAKMVNIFTAGSFLHPGEIPQQAQLDMARDVADNPASLVLRIESRVEYITEETVKPIADIMNAAGKTLDIAIGYETHHEAIRNKLLVKGVKDDEVKRAIQVIKDCGARPSMYVMLKPHFLMSEGFAIAECIDTIEFCRDAGAEEVLLQAAYISEGARHYVRWEKQFGFTPPSLWSIREVLEKTASLNVPVMLGEWATELPKPTNWPKGCDVCEDTLLDALANWRQTLDPIHLDMRNLQSCSCKMAWMINKKDTDAPDAEAVKEAIPHSHKRDAEATEKAPARALSVIQQ